MKTKILGFSLILSVLLNIFSFYTIYSDSIFWYKKNDIIVQKKQIDFNFFPEKIDLKDYTDVKYSLSDESKELINNIRNFHKVPSLIDSKFKDKEVCAWYIWSLSEKFWWKNSPYNIWMMDRDKMWPASAWELPYSYFYLWWDILVDFSDKIDLLKFRTDYWNMISKQDLLSFYSNSFSEKALLWDLWFLYKDTRHIKWLLEKWYSNSHITKNIWISKFEKEIGFTDDLDNHNLVIKKIFNSDISDLEIFQEILSRYKFYLNSKEIFYSNWEFYYLDEWQYFWEKVKFKSLDKISYNDITLVWFFENIARVDSLLEFTLKWEFFPINVISINSRLIEKM